MSTVLLTQPCGSPCGCGGGFCGATCSQCYLVTLGELTTRYCNNPNSNIHFGGGNVQIARAPSGSVWGGSGDFPIVINDIATMAHIAVQTYCGTIEATENTCWILTALFTPPLGGAVPSFPHFRVTWVAVLPNNQCPESADWVCVPCGEAYPPCIPFSSGSSQAVEDCCSVSLSPSNCEDIPGACCDSEGNCTQTTQANCDGVWHGPGVPCDPNPCSTLEQDKVACCIYTPFGWRCVMLTPDECERRGGSDSGPTCSPNPCPGGHTTIAPCCCPNNPNCFMTDPNQCAASGCTPMAGSSCDGILCPVDIAQVNSDEEWAALATGERYWDVGARTMRVKEQHAWL